MGYPGTGVVVCVAACVLSPPCAGEESPGMDPGGSVVIAMGLGWIEGEGTSA